MEKIFNWDNDKYVLINLFNFEDFISKDWKWKVGNIKLINFKKCIWELSLWNRLECFYIWNWYVILIRKYKIVGNIILV